MLVDMAYMNQVDAFYMTEYLKSFDADSLSPAMVSDEMVEEYRYRYGNLEDQVRDVAQQYQQPLKEANNAKDKEHIQELTTERDDKINAIIQNFTDSDNVKGKIVQETTKRVLQEKKEMMKQLEREVDDFKDEFFYVIMDSTGRMYKNIDHVTSDMSGKQIMRELTSRGEGQPSVHLFTTSISGARYDKAQKTALSNLDRMLLPENELRLYLVPQPDSNIARQLAQVKSGKLYWKMALAICGGILVLAVALFIRYLRAPFENHHVENFLKKMPLDLRALVLVVCVLIGLMISRLGTMSPASLVVIIVMATIALIFYLPLVKNIWFSLRRKPGYLPLSAQLNQNVTWITVQKINNWIGKHGLRTQQFLYGVIYLGVLFTWAIRSSYNIWLLNFGVIPLVTGVVTILAGLLMVDLLARMSRNRQLLQEPGRILTDFKQVATPSHTEAEVEANLEEIAKIVANSQAHRVRNEQLKSELLTNVSHDLRTPLTAIITYGDLLTQADLTPAQQREYTTVINHKALRMKHLINDLFEVTKMNNGEIVLKKEAVNLGQLIEQSLAEFSEELERADLKLVYVKPTEPIIAQVDGEKIWRVLDNLIGNVIKYALGGTRVYMKVEAHADTVELELKNISQHELNEEADNLIERFTRGDDARNLEGSGLGLAIAHSIISLHQGELRISVDGDLFKINIDLPLGK